MEFERRISLNEKEKQVLVDWGEDIYNSEALNLVWRPKQLQVVLYDQGEAKSKCGLIKQEIEVNDQRILLTGIGGVVTAPPFRHHGYARNVLIEALRIANEEWKSDAALLFCLPSMVAFYQALSWKLIESKVKVYQPQGMVIFPAATMIHPISNFLWPKNDISIDSLPW
ncbi:hypothetical protein NBRC116493_30020 [Aurantivibrio infirmus]